jgi:hypothetical protein
MTACRMGQCIMARTVHPSPPHVSCRLAALAHSIEAGGGGGGAPDVDGDVAPRIRAMAGACPRQRANEDRERAPPTRPCRAPLPAFLIISVTRAGAAGA